MTKTHTWKNRLKINEWIDKWTKQLKKDDKKNHERRTTSAPNQWLIPLEICILQLYMNENRNEEGREKKHKKKTLGNRWTNSQRTMNKVWTRLQTSDISQQIRSLKNEDINEEGNKYPCMEEPLGNEWEMNKRTNEKFE